MRFDLKVASALQKNSVSPKTDNTFIDHMATILIDLYYM